MTDRELFTALYGRQAQRILVFLSRQTFDVELAFDLTAETFAVALASWSTVRALQPEQADAWLYTVARRLLLKYERRQRIENRALRRLGAQLPQAEPDDIEFVERLAGLHELRGAVADQLASLSAPQQRALRLRLLEHRSYSEIAQTLGVSEQAVRARVSRGLRTLAKGLKPFEHHVREML